MSKVQDEEPLLPPWVMGIIVRVGPLALLFGLWYLVARVLKVSSAIATPFLGVLALAAVVYFGGRLYKPFHFNKKTHRCEAKGAKQRMACRYYMPGARLGGGCGRHREDGGCRYVQRDLRGLRRF
jgi:hypothetical protein